MFTLQTPRLRLREMSMEDADSLLGIFSDPVAMQFYPSTKDRTETEGWIQWKLNSYQQHGHGLWLAELTKTGEFAGQCGLIVQEVEGQREIEIGYLFLRKFWGQGLATEAAIASREYAFLNLKLRRVISLIDPANIASIRVAEKNGMRLEKIIEKWEKIVGVYAVESTMDI
ncbi:MAG: GNAT family N-acetyltransferase [Candidatus Sumerlaeaceae bacterium]|nr:GNAT family N-acetyltransferase [Candidatus Sumerlaeaceae bacterium]